MAAIKKIEDLYCFGCCKPPSERNYYCYYDTPEGEDIPKKMLAAARPAAIFGTIMGFHDVLMYSHTKGVSNILKRYAFWILPPLAMATVFTGVANGLVNYRQKDDTLNYIIGGAACGPILAAWTNAPVVTLHAAAFFALCAYGKKLAVDAGMPLMPCWVPQINALALMQWDFQNK